jgi:hypothetical protein
MYALVERLDFIPCRESIHSGQNVEQIKPHGNRDKAQGGRLPFIQRRSISMAI